MDFRQHQLVSRLGVLDNVLTGRLGGDAADAFSLQDWRSSIARADRHPRPRLRQQA